MTRQASNPQLSFTDLAYLEELEQEEEQREAEERERKEQEAKEQRARAKQQGATDNLALATQNQRAAELLAIISGLDREQTVQMVRKAGGVHRLAGMKQRELKARFGISEKRAEKIEAATKWAVLLNEPDTEERKRILSPVDAANMVMLEMSLLEREKLMVIGLDTKNNVTFQEDVYSGSLNSAVVRIGEVLRMAIIMNCASIVIVHNHPSGDPTPSPEDVRLTELIRQAAELLGIEVLDHVIIGRNRFVSMKERGLGFG